MDPDVTISLERAGPARLDELLPLVADYHAFEAIDSSAETRADAVGRLLQDSSLGGIWRILVENQLAGYIALCRGFSIEFNGYDGFIDEFFLLPEYRGHGVGKVVLQAVGDLAHELEINALHLEVARDNAPARRLYAGAGFEAREKYVLMSREFEGAED